MTNAIMGVMIRISALLEGTKTGSAIMNGLHIIHVDGFHFSHSECTL